MVRKWCGCECVGAHQVTHTAIALGAADSFIITACVDRAFAEATARRSKKGSEPTLSRSEFIDTFARGLGQAGSSIAFTSLTDLTAFCLGSITRIPAVRWFCLYAGVSIVMVFMMQVTRTPHQQCPCAPGLPLIGVHVCGVGHAVCCGVVT